MQAGFTIALIPPIMRRDYIAALEKAHKNDADFIIFIAQMVKETLIICAYSYAKHVSKTARDTE